MSEQRDPIEYLLNAMEHAAQSIDPALAGYRDKRKAVLSAIAELRKDAERYRWLRVNSTQPAEGWSTHSNPESLDAAIDAAMSQEPAPDAGAG